MSGRRAARLDTPTAPRTHRNGRSSPDTRSAHRRIDRVDSARSGQGPEAVVGTAARPSRRRRSVDRRSRVIRRHRDSRSFAAAFHESRGWLPPPRRSRTSPAGRCRRSRRRWRAHQRRASTTHRACSERSGVHSRGRTRVQVSVCRCNSRAGYDVGKSVWGAQSRFMRRGCIHG
jgi:hypothetical protein